MGADNASAANFVVRGDGSEIAQWVGRSLDYRAPFPVEAGRVADYCSMVEDANPLYWAPNASIAPPGTLTIWRWPSPWAPPSVPVVFPLLAPQIPLPADTLINAGFSCRFLGPITIGDRLRYVETIELISDQKKTALGTGYFIRTRVDVFGQDGEQIATCGNAMFRYDKGSPTAEPKAKAEPAAAPKAPPPNEMPEIAIPITPTLIALGVAATRDYFPGHHDAAYAQGQGVADSYPNTAYYCGLMDRVATQWAGYKAEVVQRDLTMFTPAPIGKTLRPRGHVTSRTEQDGRALVGLDISILADEALIARAAITLKMF